MHKRLAYGLLAGIALAAAFLGGARAAGDEAGPCQGKRQCYPGGWVLRSDKAYYYRRYYFKAGAKDTQYKYHYVIYYPKEDWMYYYDPAGRTYWCRAYRDVSDKEGKLWVVLPRGKARKARLGEIPAEAWDRPREIPLVPGSHATGNPDDQEVMLAPPPPPKG
jgi:hypothetical protein